MLKKYLIKRKKPAVVGAIFDQNIRFNWQEAQVELLKKGFLDTFLVRANLGCDDDILTIRGPTSLNDNFEGYHKHIFDKAFGADNSRKLHVKCNGIGGKYFYRGKSRSNKKIFILNYIFLKFMAKNGNSWITFGTNKCELCKKIFLNSLSIKNT